MGDACRRSLSLRPFWLLCEKARLTTPLKKEMSPLDDQWVCVLRAGSRRVLGLRVRELCGFTFVWGWVCLDRGPKI